MKAEKVVKADKTEKTEPPVKAEQVDESPAVPDDSGSDRPAAVEPAVSDVAGSEVAGSELTEAETTATEPTEADAPSGRWWGRAIALGAAIVVFVAVGTAFEVRGHSLQSQTPAKNHALSDTDATSEVIGQVSTALNKVLSYNYQSPAVTQQAATQLLTGDAAGQYKTLFAALQQKAPGEKLTLTAKVVVAGVTQLHGDTAQLLVFLDQSSTRASDKQSSTSAAQLDVTAVKQGDSWKISELLPL